MEDEVFAADGELQETFAVQHDSWEAWATSASLKGHPGTSSGTDQEGSRDDRAVAVGLPPTSPRRSLAWQMEEVVSSAKGIDSVCYVHSRTAQIMLVLLCDNTPQTSVIGYSCQL